MKTFNTQPTALTRRESLIALLGTIAGLTACGGGDDSGVTGGGGIGGTGSFSVGPISGFGSVIVNGVRYDDTRASITSDDGSVFPRSSLSLGMLVAVQGSTPSNGLSTATSIVVSGELQGPISGTPNSSNKTFVVLGQTVEVRGNTFFSASLRNGFASLSAGTVVEVHGLADPANNRLLATYIEQKNAPSEYKIQGFISNLDENAKTFTIGSIRLNYGSANDIRVPPANNALVRVRMLAANPAPATWTVTRIRKPEDALADQNEVEFTGLITAFTSLSSFSVNNTPVDARSATFPEGTAGIILGARVEVKGSVSGGVLRATRVKPQDDDALEFELHGTVSNLSTHSGGGAFTLTSASGFTVQVVWANGITFLGGTAAGLTSGRRIEAKGLLADASSSSSRVTASRISFEN